MLGTSSKQSIYNIEMDPGEMGKKVQNEGKKIKF